MNFIRIAIAVEVAPQGYGVGHGPRDGRLAPGQCVQRRGHYCARRQGEGQHHHATPSQKHKSLPIERVARVRVTHSHALVSTFSRLFFHLLHIAKVQDVSRQGLTAGGIRFRDRARMVI